MRRQKYIPKICVCIFIIFLFPFYGFSQDISGVWTGRLYNDTTKEYIPFELAINESNGKADGFSHTTFISGKGNNVGVKSVKIKFKNGDIIVEDDKFVYNNFPEPPPKGVKMYATLNLSKRDTTEILKGTWKTNATKLYRPLTGAIYLEKKSKHPEQTPIVKKLDDLGLASQLSFLSPPQNTEAINAKAREDSIKKQQEMEALAKAQKAKEDSLMHQQEMDALAKDQQAKEDSLKKQQEMDALAKAQQAKEDSLKSQQEMDALAKAQKAKDDSLKKQQEIDALAKAQKEKEDSLKKQQEMEALANAQKARVDSIKNKEEMDALAKARKAKGDSINQQQQKEAIAKAARDKLLHAQQAKDELAKQRLAQEELAKEQNAKDELAKRQQAQEELAKAQNAKDELERQKRAQDELAKIQKANPTAASDLSNRKLETIKTVEISQDSLQLTLYDNGTVDGDTVSVLLNGKVIWPRVGLLATPINKTIYLTPEMGDSISIIMYAENLGSIPPNTGLLIIREAKKIYYIQFSGDLNKNSKIILVRKKKN
ncbi:MAG: hypothetical protein ABI267_00365 [Ginsengibacter sp.]